MASMFTTGLTLIGGLGLALGLYQVLDFIYFYFLVPCRLHRYQRPSGGVKSSSTKQETRAWALVTGASDGIGFQTAMELARKGFNVVLHGRNATKLSERMSTLQRQFPAISFRTTVADASELSTETFNNRISTLSDEMAALPGRLTILINNIGGIPGDSASFRSFDEQLIEDIEATINMNIRFTTRLTHSLIPLLKQNGPGLIIVIGSGSGNIGIPYLSIYSAAKAYLKIWTMSVATEFALNKVDIEMLGIDVGKVTETAGMREAVTFWVPSANRMAKAILARIGCGRNWVWGFGPHAVQGGFIDLLPRSVMLKEIARLLEEPRKTVLENMEKSKAKAA